ncbi:DUF2147 domain-containing protein [Umboniibacter marinipuniceus]|uniref:Uncharacterized protein (DUF2147 family) n=1 Tax=Umboniibacter marinipuniceus TaxID=569599 RepID=A0A3M0AC16_9GAMM|nr:DUF2147 domain-containing protein [Umboniibacter marinipuniceus]RMA81119.1 uncharacterized protein (DUF2147 family) [Umboniibacter marinipuniceus]
MKFFAVLSGFMMMTLVSVAQADNAPVGLWNTIDDTSGEAKSTVELYMEGDRLYGRIIELINPDEPNPVCEQCTGEKLNQPVIGLTIIEGLSFDGDYWSDGEILDPENGKSYDCRIWREGNKLMVRGYIGFFYRTQSWILSESASD